MVDAERCFEIWKFAEDLLLIEESDDYDEKM